MQIMLSFWNLSTCCFGSLRLDRLHPDKVSRNRKVRGKFVTGGVCRNRNWRCSCWTRTSCSSCRQLLKDFTIYKNTLRCCAVAVAIIKRSRVQILLCSSLFYFSTFLFGSGSQGRGAFLSLMWILPSKNATLLHCARQSYLSMVPEKHTAYL